MMLASVWQFLGAVVEMLRAIRADPKKVNYYVVLSSDNTP